MKLFQRWTNIGLFVYAISLPLFAQAALNASESWKSIPNLHNVTRDISRGGRPSRSDVTNLEGDGVKTIINIENDTQAVNSEMRHAEGLGMNYIRSPMSWSSRPSDRQIDQILGAMQDRQNFPIFLHCKHGRDRTGLIIGLYRVLVQGWEPRDAYREMLDLGFRPHLTALDSYFKRRTGMR